MIETEKNSLEEAIKNITTILDEDRVAEILTTAREQLLRDFKEDLEDVSEAFSISPFNAAFRLGVLYEKTCASWDEVKVDHDDDDEE